MVTESDHEKERRHWTEYATREQWKLETAAMMSAIKRAISERDKRFPAPEGGEK